MPAPWSYYAAPDFHSIFDVIVDLKKKLNELATSSPRVAATTKIVTSDQRDGYARGVIFYCTGGIDLLPPLGTKWQNKTFWTNNNYVGDLYKPAEAVLSELDVRLAVSAHATTTNYKGGSATLTLWWPSEPTQ